MWYNDPNKSPWRYKWNRDEIKAAYFNSPIMELKKFLFDNYKIKRSWQVAERTAPWRKEKDELLKRAHDEAIRQTEEKLIEYYKPDIKELWKMHKLIMMVITKKIAHMARAENMEQIFSSEVEKLWKMIKVEKNEPITVNKNIDTVQNKVEFSEEDKEKVDSLMKSYFND